jgi:hypothetical protein
MMFKIKEGHRDKANTRDGYWDPADLLLITAYVGYLGHEDTLVYEVTEFDGPDGPYGRCQRYGADAIEDYYEEVK